MTLRYTVVTVLPAIVMDALDAVHSSEHFRPHTDNNTKNTSTACASLALRWLLPKAHKKKSGLTHWPCSHVVCSAFFHFTSHFSSLSQTLVFSQGVELHAKKTKKLHHCVSNLYGFLWFSVMFIILHLCIYRHDMSF